MLRKNVKNAIYFKNNLNIKRSLHEVLRKEELTIKDIPHPISWPIFGTKIDFWLAGSGSKLHEYVDSRHKCLGKVFCEQMNSTDIVFISDPGMMKTLFLNLEGKYPGHILPEPWILYEKLYGSKRGLFFMNGEEWLTQRRILNKHLLKETSHKWLETPIKNTITEYINNWKIKIKTRENVFNLESELYRLSIEVIIAVLCGNSNPKKSLHYDEILLLFADEVKKIFSTTTKLAGLPLKLCQQLNLKPWQDFRESVDNSLLIAHKLIKEMLQNKLTDGDGLLSKLMQENVPEDIMIRIVSDFVIAAGDTTSFTTLWTLYLLATNKESSVYCASSDEGIKSIIKESMRLYPVAPFLTRILPKECILGGYKLKQWTPIVASIYTSGRDEENFSRASQFLPYRWDRNDPRRGELLNHQPTASMPFALGARSCIGRKMAMLQLQEIIKQIVENFDIKCSNSSQDIKPVTCQVLVPDKPIELQFSLRK